MTKAAADSGRSSPSGRSNRFALGVLGAVLCSTLAVMSALGWCSWDSYHGFKTLQGRDFRLQELVGEIRHLDEVLTMSARMAVATDDFRWVDRYRDFEPVLEAAIHEVMELAPEIHATGGMAQTNAANTRLVEMEFRSFDLMRQGRSEDAAALLSGEVYESQKEAYRKGMEESLSALQTDMQDMLETRRMRAYQAATAVVGILPVLLLSWLYALRTLRAHLRARKRTEEALQTAHDELEQHVDERTADLTTANKRLEQEIAERERAEQTLQLHGAIVDGMAEGVFVIRASDGVIVYTNPTFERMFRYDVGELVGKHVNIINAPTAANPLDTYADIARALTGKGTWSGTAHNVRKDGTTFWAHSVVVTLDHPAYGRVWVDVKEDVTERRQADATLRESEERYRALFEQAPDSIVQIDPETGGFVRFNARAHESLGYTREEFECLKVADLEVVESIEQVAQHIQTILETGGDVFETKHRTKDGAVRDILVNARIVSIHGQSLFQSIWTDITERKRAEEALKYSSKKLAVLAEEQQTLLRNTRDFLYRHDTNGVFNYMSPSVEQITGRAVDDWCKHYSAFLTDNPINQKVVAYTEETLRTGKQSPTYLVEVMHQDGRRIMLEVNERAYFDEGKVAGIVGVARDVTDRVHAEEALRASEQRLQGILDNSTAVIYVKDRDGRYLLANHCFEELFHLTREQFVGKTDHELFSKDRADGFRANDMRVLEEGRPVEFEETVHHDDGSRTYISLKFPLYDPADKPYAVCGISTDITERQHARQKLQEAKEAAEAASKSKSTFLANVSHEIRTPIMAMLGAAELMAQGGTDHPAPGRLDVILRSGHHLLSLVEDLLDISRAEQGKLEIRFMLCSPFEIMADVEAVVAPLHRKRGIDFRVIYETPIPVRIHTDPTRLKQAVINLVSNALKFTEAGHVAVRLRVDPEADDPRLVITVEDTGQGIDSHDLQRIFDVFTQLDREASVVSMGVGLGLPLAKWIADQLGGTLEVASVVGRGSTFTLRVATGPVADVDWVTYGDLPSPSEQTDQPESQVPTAIDETPLQTPARLHGRVLLAEDVRDLRELIASVLSDAGAEVTAVSDGKEALDTASKGSFDLILMDVRMPKMGGSLATAELRKRGCLTPIIALTASTAPGDRERLLKGGFDDLWTKPISMARIVEGVADYLDSAQDDSDSDSNAQPAPSSIISSARMESAVADFAKSLGARLQKLHDALKANDSELVHNILHQLIGTAGTLGFMPLSTEAARLLAMINDGSSIDDHQALRPLEELIKKSTRQVAQQSE